MVAGSWLVARAPFVAAEVPLLVVANHANGLVDSLLVVCAMYFDLQGNQLPRELARGWVREGRDYCTAGDLPVPSETAA